MIPDLRSALDSLALRLASRVAPVLPVGSYEAADAALVAGLLSAAGQEAERGVAVRLTDMAELRPLFTDACARLPDDALRQRLAALLDDRQGDLTLSAVDAAHSSWLEALADLHAAVDDVDAPAALRALDERIWRFLETHTERHAYHLPL
jgi:hypothetical protein